MINSLKDSIRVLNETLPGDITLTIELAQEIVESAVIVATKITGKSLQVRFIVLNSGRSSLSIYRPKVVYI